MPDLRIAFMRPTLLSRLSFGLVLLFSLTRLPDYFILVKKIMYSVLFAYKHMINIHMH